MATNRNPSVTRQIGSQPMIAAPQSSAASAMARAAEQAGLGVVEYKQQRIGEEMQDELMARQEAVLTEIETTDEQLSPAEFTSMQDFASYMSDLQMAAEQRSRSITDLKIAQERTLREYMARYPQLTDRLQQAATGILGYQPLGARMRAAEAASRSAGVGAMPDIMKMYMQQAASAGVPMELYYSNPAKFWEMAHREVSRSGQAKSMATQMEVITSQLGIAQTVQSGIFSQYMTTLAPEAWNNDIAPVMNDYLNALGVTGNLSPAERAARISEAKGGEQWMMFQAEITRRRAQFVADAYAEYYDRFAAPIDSGYGTAFAAPLSRDDFERQLAPVLAQYDWALANISQAGALDHVKSMNDLVEQGIIADMPRGVRAAEIYGRMFGPDNTYSQVLLKGEASTIAAEVIHAAMIPAITGSGRPGAPKPNPIIDPQTGSVRPQGARDDGTRMLSPEEIMSRGGFRDAGTVNYVYEEALRNWVSPWMETSNTLWEDDPQQAQIAGLSVLKALQKYANMVVEAEKNKTQRPSRETDMAYVAAMANPQFGQLTRNMYRSGLLPTLAQELFNMVDIMRGLTQESFIQAEDRILRILKDPMSAAPTSDAYGFPANFTPGPGFVAATFASNIDISVDPESHVVSFAKKPNAPEYNKLTDYVVIELNNLPPTMRQELGQLAAAFAHVQGQGPEAYDRALKLMLGL